MADTTNYEVAAEAVKAHAERMTTFVNTDVLNLRRTVNALVARLEIEGVDEEHWPREWLGTLEWARDHATHRVCEHMTISLCAALEVFAEDVFVSVCLAVPPTHDKFRKVKMAITDLMPLSDAERYRALWNGFDREAPFIDRCDDLFGLLGIKADVEPFHDSLPAPYADRADNSWIRTTLKEMYAVRNAVLHRGAADERLVRVSPSRFRLGDRIEIEDDTITDYGIAAHSYAGALGAGAALLFIARADDDAAKSAPHTG